MSELIEKFNSLSIEQPASLSREQEAQAAQWRSIVKKGSLAKDLDELNLCLRDNSFILSTVKPSGVDVEVFEVALPLVKELTFSSKDVKATYARYRHVLRWIDFLQRLLDVPESEQLKINYDLELPHEVVEKKKKGGEAEKKEQQAQQAQPEKPRGKPDEETLKKLREEAKAKKAAKKAAANSQPQQKPESEKPKPSAIDFRVGFIQKAIKHPDADSLYVSTIDVGDAEGPRTVCSGLVKYYPLEAMQERLVVCVCNLKPVNMRGIKSSAMVLCGSDESKVEFVEPPVGSKAGDKVFFEGFGDEEPLKQLNPKKKIWEQLQPHFTTDEQLQVIFKDEEDKEKPVRKLTNAKGDSFKVVSLVDAQVR
ncbi:hypothetical protein HG536_0D01990 [Torulaspora globosa]|uniref:tRNA-binding domain-containing protein n=1 Tax=Torulaspora globosa TaxID=48254 RepID=A0A7G3ZGP1_9SACH|nr:uncharacterized protein HG536_0D01990 [Torulaspora globosa]QLL32677.1 hypothetical protein HG536_0D01990 [Torulaspora globosa]